MHTNFYKLAHIEILLFFLKFNLVNTFLRFRMVGLRPTFPLEKTGGTGWESK